MIRVDKNTIGDIPEVQRGLCLALLKDIDDINCIVPDVGFYIVYNDDENDDYYGTYRVKTEKMGESESIGMEMTLSELDDAICVIYDTIEVLTRKEE